MPVINPVVSGTTPTGSVAPCVDWPITWTCDTTGVDPGIVSLAVTTATHVLWALSGRRFGVCEVTLRPCRRDCQGGAFYDDFGPPWAASYWPQPALIGGLWFNLGCGGCAGDCSCTAVSEVLLPAPVYQVTEVLIDGTPLVTGAYRLDNNRILVRTDGDEWPACNDLNLDDDQPGTWSITAQYGEPIPDSARLAMGELACEIIRAATGGDCRLPIGVQQLIRQGVTISFPDVGELFERGRTGLYLTDLFIATWNPSYLRTRSRVYRVDRPEVRRAGT